MPTQQNGGPAAKTFTQADIDEAVRQATEAAQTQAAVERDDAVREAVQAAAGPQGPSSGGKGTKSYTLLADALNQPTNKPGEPFTFVSYVKGDKVPLNDEQADRLIAAGAVLDPKETAAGKPGAETQAPKGD